MQSQQPEIYPPICVISPDPELHKLLLRMQDETTTRYATKVGLFDEALEVAREFIAGGAKILISRSETTNTLRDANINVPVLDIPLTEYDIIPLLDQARKFSDRIAVVGFGSTIRAAKALAPILSIELGTFQARSAKDVPEMVRQLHEQKFPVMVGNQQAVVLCRELGIHGIGIVSDEHVVHTVLADAAKMLEVMQHEDRLRQYRYTQQDQFRESTFGEDDEPGRLGGARTTADLGRLFAEAFHQDESLISLVKHTEIFEAVETGLPWEGALEDESGDRYICRIVPVRRDKNTLGSVVFLEKNTPAEQALRRELPQKGFVAWYNLADIVHKGEAMRKFLALARDYAMADSPLLIEGESGTGKEMVAQGVHNASRRRYGPFVAINCAAIPEHLLESELFGYHGGAFTGARREGKPGLLEIAHAGSIFLDEVGEMSPSLQAKLLRVLDEQRFMRVGGDKVIHTDVRVIAATNRNLSEMAASGAFRSDLFYRLGILRLQIPPLRERKGDIPALASYFAKTISRKLGKPEPRIHPDTFRKLIQYAYPGNIRELGSIMERSLVCCRKSILEPGDILVHDTPVPAREVQDTAGSIRRAEQECILAALEECNGNKGKTAKKLGISTTTLWRKLKQM